MMMADTHTKFAAEVIQGANREKPADAVLRSELRRRGGISRRDGRAISRAVFAFYRWYGWLDPKRPIERRIAQALEIDEAFQRNSQSFSDQEMNRAIPSWLAAEMEVSAPWLRSLQLEPLLWLRARPGQGRGLAEKLLQARLSESLPDAVVYEGKEDLFRTPEFQAGEFELQDLSSQIVGLVCAPQPGETWWDACAGEGGKTLHLCDLMGNRGLVWASDRAGWRLQKLKRRAARARLFNYRSVVWDGGGKPPVKTKLNGVLVDAPCSGVGTWQRNPHARWTTTPEDVRELAEVQQRLLTNAVGALRPGGRLVYSVCTMTRAETVEVAEAISGLFPELRAEAIDSPIGRQERAGRLWLWPQTMGGNGMFIARWRKEG